MKRFLFWLLVIFLSFLQASIFTAPLALALIISDTFINRKSSVLLLAFVAGLVFDIFSVRQLGQMSLFFVVCSFLIFLYSNKFETRNPTFVALFTFVSAASFTLYLHLPSFFWGGILSSLVSCAFFFISEVNIKKVRFSL